MSITAQHYSKMKKRIFGQMLDRFQSKNMATIRLWVLELTEFCMDANSHPPGWSLYKVQLPRPTPNGQYCINSNPCLTVSIVYAFITLLYFVKNCFKTLEMYQNNFPDRILSTGQFSNIYKYITIYQSLGSITDNSKWLKYLNCLTKISIHFIEIVNLEGNQCLQNKL